MKAAAEAKRITKLIKDGKMKEDEPLFVLRAQDILAADLVLAWAVRARKLDVKESKLHEAETMSAEMRKWPGRGIPD